MNITILSQEHKDTWNDLVNGTPTGHVMQTWEFGDVREASGTQIVRIGMFEKDTLVGGAQMSVHPIPKLPYQIGYIARGPVFANETESILTDFLKFLKQYAHANNIAFIKLEPNVPIGSVKSEIWTNSLNSLNAQISSNPRFMNATSMIDLTKSEEELLRNCRKNTRYYIRKAEREGFVFREAIDKSDLTTFYKLLKDTSQRQNFSLAARPLSYFEHLWDIFRPSTPNTLTNIRLFFAELEGTPVATVLNLYAGKKAYYPYGASSLDARGTAATEGLMWHCVMQAKQAGCVKYDLWGILAEEDKEHPYWGFTFFKHGFGGEQINYIGSYDFPTKPWLYKPLIWLEKLRRQLIRWNIV